MIRVDYIADPFATLNRIRTHEAPSGALASSYAPSGFDCDRNIVILNGRRITDDTPLEAGDHVTFARVPAGVLAALGPAFAGPVVQVVVTVTLALVTFGLRKSLLSPGVRPERPEELENESPTRGFNGIHNTRGAGNPLAWVAGRHRVGGQIIQQFQRPVLDVQVGDEFQTVIARNDNPAGSKSVIYTHIAMCEGPIRSIADVQFDDVDIAKLRGVLYSTSTGLDDHTGGNPAPRGFNKIGTIQSVNQNVTVAGGAVTFTTDTEVDDLELVLRFSFGLYLRILRIIIGYTVEIKVEYRVSDPAEPWTTLTGANIKIRDKNVAAVEFRVGFPPFDQRAKYDIRVTRITADTIVIAPNTEESSFTVKDALLYTVDRRSHPGVAKLAIEHSIADQDSQLIPSRITALVEGLDNIRVFYSTDPTDYALEYTQNPAWVLADLLTSAERGNGDIYTYDDIDLESFYAWSQYCDELVGDGRGGFEPRCRYDFVHDTSEDTQTIRNRIAFCGDAWCILSGGKWRIVIDRPSPMVDVFNDANIEPGSLEYAYVPKTERATKIAGHFTNLELDYARDVAYDEDDTVIPAGAVHREVAQDCFGMTRLSQVKRSLRRLLLWNRYSDRQLSFRTGLEGCTLTAGSVFGFASRFAGVGLEGGHVQGLADGGKTIFLDGFLNVESGKSYEVIVRFQGTGTRQTKPIEAMPVGLTDAVRVASDWVEGIAVGDMYSLGEIGGALELFRVTTIADRSDLSREVTARKYSPNIYDLSGLVTPAATTLSGSPSPVAFPDPVVGLKLVASEFQTTSGAETVKAIMAGWEAPENGDAASWDVWYRRSATEGDEESWNLSANVKTRSHLIYPLSPSTSYDVAVVAVGPSGNSLSIEDSAQKKLAIGA